MKRKTDWDWNWQPPFSDPNSPHYFQREHWWNLPENKSSESPEAAWYELLRRHPQVANGMKEWGTDDWEWADNALTILEDKTGQGTLWDILPVIGRTCWVKLSDNNKKAFTAALANTRFQRGRSRKAEVHVVNDPSKLAESADLYKLVRQEAERFSDQLRAFSYAQDTKLPVRKAHPGWKLCFKLMKKVPSGPLHRNTYEPGFIPGAQNYFQTLYRALLDRRLVLIVDLDTDDPKDGAQRLAEEYLAIFQNARSEAPERKTRSEHWLRIIAGFESSEVARLRQAQSRKVNQKERRAFQKLLADLVTS